MQNKLVETTLPNGMKAFCIWEWEARKEVNCSYEHVQAYINNGIEIKENDVVFDLGANIGLFMLYVYSRCNGNIDVYAFEPMPPIYDALRENAKLHNEHRLKTFPVGISSKVGKMNFTYYPMSTTIGTAYPDLQDKELVQPLIDAFNTSGQNSDFIYTENYKSDSKDNSLSDKALQRAHRMRAVLGLNNAFKSETVECDVVTISHIIKMHEVKQIDLLKVHVEKSEMDVFAGILDEDWGKIKQVVVNIEGSDRLNNLKEILEKHGFNHIVIEEEKYVSNLDSNIIFAKRVL